MKARIKLEWFDNRWCVRGHKEKDSNIWWWPIMPSDLLCVYHDLLSDEKT
jgi:hypothetical protein